MKPKVIILMSTYNGEKYLKEQLESILNQSYKNIEILIRDDGSIDNTIKILQEFSNKYENVNFYQGENLKPAKSFLNLIKSVKRADYYAFSDQDDIWYQDKIETAINFLEEDKSKLPKLYFSNTQLVDKELNEISNVRKIDKRKINVGNALIENIATGCTMVFNFKLGELLKRIEYEDVKLGFMHDSLAYRICFATGHVVYDEKPHIAYRQHENNVIGNSSNFKDKLNKRKKTIKTTIKLRSTMTKYILQKYEKYIDESNIKYIRMIAEYDEGIKNKIDLIFNKEIKRMSKIDDILYRLAILLGKL